MENNNDNFGKAKELAGINSQPQSQYRVNYGYPKRQPATKDFGSEKEARGFFNRIGSYDGMDTSIDKISNGNSQRISERKSSYASPIDRFNRHYSTPFMDGNFLEKHKGDLGGYEEMVKAKGESPYVKYDEDTKSFLPYSEEDAEKYALSWFDDSDKADMDDIDYMETARQFAGLQNVPYGDEEGHDYELDALRERDEKGLNNDFGPEPGDEEDKDSMDPNSPKYKNFNPSDATNVKQVGESQTVINFDTGKPETWSILEYIPYGALKRGDNRKLYGLATNYDGSDTYNNGLIVAPSLESAKEQLKDQILLSKQGRERFTKQGKWDEDYFNMLRDKNYDWSDEDRAKTSKKYGWDLSKDWKDQQHVKEANKDQAFDFAGIDTSSKSKL